MTDSKFIRLQAGYKDVVHMKGGLSQWRFDGLPVEEA